MDIIIKDHLRAAVEAASGGRVTILYDDLGNPSCMVRIPRMDLFRLNSGLAVSTGSLHPAFIAGGKEKKEIFVGQFAAVIVNDRAVSLPGTGPAEKQFADARSACESKGHGWHMMTNAEWSALALWCLANGFQPRGNTNQDYASGTNHENGTRFRLDLVSGTISGTGPATWRHDGTLAGISDLVGNYKEWVDGILLTNNEFYIADDYKQAQASWPATGVLMSNGRLGATGDTPETASVQVTWKDLLTTTTYDALANAVKYKMRQHCIDPNITSSSNAIGQIHTDADGGTFHCSRGGNLLSAANGGMFALEGRLSPTSYCAFRPVYIP